MSHEVIRKIGCFFMEKYHPLLTGLHRLCHFEPVLIKNRRSETAVITKLYFYQVSGHSIITDKWMITIALIVKVKVKGSAFLSAVCIKKSGIQIKNNSLWHLNTVNSHPKYSGNRKELV